MAESRTRPCRECGKSFVQRAGTAGTTVRCPACRKKADDAVAAKRKAAECPVCLNDAGTAAKPRHFNWCPQKPR